jgi:hypothetical protein
LVFEQQLHSLTIAASSSVIKKYAKTEGCAMTKTLTDAMRTSLEPSRYAWRVNFGTVFSGCRKTSIELIGGYHGKGYLKSPRTASGSEHLKT